MKLFKFLVLVTLVPVCVQASEMMNEEELLKHHLQKAEQELEEADEQLEKEREQRDDSKSSEDAMDSKEEDLL